MHENFDFIDIMRVIPRYGLYATQGLGDWVDSLHIEWIPTRSGPHNWKISPHTHKSFIQILYLTAGGGRVEIGDRVWNVTAPCILSIPEQTVHSFHFTSDVDGPVITAVQHLLEVFVGMSSPELVPLVHQPAVIELTSESGHEGELMPLFRALHSEFHNRDLSQAGICMSLFTALFLRIARIRYSEGAPRRLGSTRKAEQLQKFQNLVEEHFRQRRPLSAYAAELGVTVGHLSRLCREALGVSALAVINARVLHEAQRDLIYTITPIKVVAASFGFDDEVYFSRFFRKHTGFSPSKYRERVSNQLAREAQAV